MQSAEIMFLWPVAELSLRGGVMRWAITHCTPLSGAEGKWWTDEWMCRHLVYLLSFPLKPKSFKYNSNSCSQKPILLQGHERSITQIKYNREGDLLFSVAKDTVSSRRRFCSSVRHSTSTPVGFTLIQLPLLFPPARWWTCGTLSTASGWAPTMDTREPCGAATATVSFRHAKNKTLLMIFVSYVSFEL